MVSMCNVVADGLWMFNVFSDGPCMFNAVADGPYIFNDVAEAPGRLVEMMRVYVPLTLLARPSQYMACVTCCDQWQDVQP